MHVLFDFLHIGVLAEHVLDGAILADHLVVVGADLGAGPAGQLVLKCFLDLLGFAPAQGVQVDVVLRVSPSTLAAGRPGRGSGLLHWLELNLQARAQGGVAGVVLAQVYADVLELTWQ